MESLVEKAEGAPGTGRCPGSVRWWLIARDGPCGRLEALTVGHGGGRTLPIFCFREEAELFLGLGGIGRADGDGWRARESGPGEVASVLCGPCRGVRRGALDPLPGTFVDGRAGLVGVGRAPFLGRLLGRGRGRR